MKNKILFLIAAAIFAISFAGCNDSDGDYPRYDPLWTTVRTLENDAYYFERGNGEKLYPSDKSRIGSYKATDGNRAIISFNLINQKIEGYDYNIALYGIRDILTKDPKTITTSEELAAVGDDNIEFLQAQISGGYIDIAFGMPAEQGSRHELNLIINRVYTPEQIAEGYIGVELRHNANGNTSGYYQENYVSFKLSDLDPSISGSKGFYLRVKTLYEGIKYYKIDAPEKH